MIDAAELDERSVPMNWVMDQEFENIELAQRNLLPRIARFVQRRLLLSTQYASLFMYIPCLSFSTVAIAVECCAQTVHQVLLDGQLLHPNPSNLAWPQTPRL